MYETPLYIVRLTWTLLKNFNIKLSECISMIDMKKEHNQIFPLSLSYTISSMRELWMTPIKLEFL
jgi:hypothetical protein